MSYIYIWRWHWSDGQVKVIPLWFMLDFLPEVILWLIDVNQRQSYPITVAHVQRSLHYAAHESRVSPTGSVCWRHDTGYVRPSITALCNLTRHIARQQFVSTPSSVHHRHWWRHYPEERDHKEQTPPCQKKNYDTTQRQDCSLLRHYFHPIYFNFQKYGKTDVT